MYGAGEFLRDSIRACVQPLGRAKTSVARYFAPGMAMANRISIPVGSLLFRIVGSVDRIRIPNPVVIMGGLTLLALLMGPGVYYNLLRDEGYLWYGAQRVLAGQIPFRDFQTYYDPARYYLVAAVMAVLGNHGLTGLWSAMALCGVVTAWIAGRLIFNGAQRSGLWVILAFTTTLIVWMFPESYKLLDIATSLILVALLAWIIERPIPFRCFMAGVGLGLVAIIGRDHALYGALAGVVALGYVSLIEKRVRPVPAFAYCAAGVLVGYLPMLLALVFVRGLWSPFWDGIRLYFVLGRTNLGLPMPWPWLVPHTMQLLGKLRYILIGMLLMLQPLIGLAIVGYSVWRFVARKIPVNSLLFAAALLAITYAHHAFARPGINHLAEAIYPLLIALFAIAVSRPPATKIAFATLICAVSVFVELPTQPPYVFESTGRKTAVQVGTDMLWFGYYEARLMSQLNNLVNRYAPQGRGFVAVPYMPGYYAMFDRPAVTWASYMLSPADHAEQEMEIERIQVGKPAFILVEIEQQDHIPALSFRGTHPEVYEFIRKHYRRVDDPDVPRRMELYLPQ